MKRLIASLECGYLHADGKICGCKHDVMVGERRSVLHFAFTKGRSGMPLLGDDVICNQCIIRLGDEASRFAFVPVPKYLEFIASYAVANTAGIPATAAPAPAVKAAPAPKPERIKKERKPMPEDFCLASGVLVTDFGLRHEVWEAARQAAWIANTGNDGIRAELAKSEEGKAALAKHKEHKAAEAAAKVAADQPEADEPKDETATVAVATTNPGTVNPADVRPTSATDTTPINSPFVGLASLAKPDDSALPS